jgi:hypothetical protein
MHRVVVARQSSSVQSSHAKSRGSSRAPVGNKSAKDSSSKGAAVNSNQAKTGSAQRRTISPAAKPGSRSKSRHSRRPVQVDDHNQPLLHRASNGRTHITHPGRRVQQELAARHSRSEPTSLASTTEPVATPRTASSSAPTDTKALTVSDFMNAASAPPASVYASGESHPDGDVSSSPTPSAQLAKRPVVVARVEAAPTANEPIQTYQPSPSDLVGAPVVPAQKVIHPSTALNDVAPSTRATSRQELIAEVEQPVVLPGLYRNGRLVVPAPLRGTREILVHQNTMADDEGLERVQDDDDLRRMRASRQLIDFPESASLHLNPDLAENRRCARPWAVRFASDVARAYYARFHEPLQVNSAVRTVAYQVRLRRVNGNAAGVDGDVASPHLTGEALDFGKRGMTMQQIAWMRTYLLPLMQGGKLDVEEEFQQACFHISVYRAYLPAAKRRSVVRSEVAQLGEPRVPRTAQRADQVQ